jgi:hypothetical protein
VDVKLTLIIMLMFLRGLNLENLATAQPGACRCVVLAAVFIL